MAGIISVVSGKSFQDHRTIHLYDVWGKTTTKQRHTRTLMYMLQFWPFREDKCNCAASVNWFKKSKANTKILWCVNYLFIPIFLFLIHRLKAKLQLIFKLLFQSYEFWSSHDNIRSCLETRNLWRLFLVLSFLYMTLGSIITATEAALILVSQHFLQKPRVADPPSQGWKVPHVFPRI